MKKKLNIKMVSELAGVSTTAVSFVLNNKPGVSEKTRQRVQEIIDQEGYTPNVNSRRLILKRSFNIYVVMDAAVSLNNLFYSSILNILALRCSEMGYNLVLSTRTHRFETSAAAEAIRTGNVDGLLFIRDIDNETQFQLRDAGTPFVVLDSHKRHPEYACSRGDYELAAYTATKYCIEKGHTAIGFVGMGGVQDFYMSTFDGYRRALAERELTVHTSWMKSEANDADSAHMCMEKMLQCDSIPTAVICPDDIVAISCMSCAQQHGYAVPKDISFVGIDDQIIAKNCYPPLTTVRIDEQEMAEQALRILFRMIEGSTEQEVYIVRSDELIERKSIISI